MTDSPFLKMFGASNGKPYVHTFNPAQMRRPDWISEEDIAAIAAFIDEHGQPVAWEIEDSAGEYLTTHCRFADGAVLSFTNAPEETP